MLSLEMYWSCVNVIIGDVLELCECYRWRCTGAV